MRSPPFVPELAPASPAAAVGEGGNALGTVVTRTRSWSGRPKNASVFLDAISYATVSSVVLVPKRTAFLTGGVRGGFGPNLLGGRSKAVAAPRQVFDPTSVLPERFPQHGNVLGQRALFHKGAWPEVLDHFVLVRGMQAARAKG